MSTVASIGLLDLLGIELPIIQAPMAGATTPQMVVAASEAGGLGSLPTARYNEDELRAAVDQIRAGTRRPINLNFFSRLRFRPRAVHWNRCVVQLWLLAGTISARSGQDRPSRSQGQCRRWN